MTDTRRDDRLDWLERLIQHKINMQMSIVESPAAHPDDQSAAAKEVTRWIHLDVIRRRHEDCGTGFGYCDDGGHGFVDGPPFGCADLEDLFMSLSHYPEFRMEWLHTS